MTQHDTDMTHAMTTSGHVPVEEAARLLDISVDAIRKRIERGTLRSTKVSKTRYVLLDDVMTHQDADRTRQDADMTSLLTSMQDQIDTLKQELEDRKEEARRKDAILMTMAQRIPELEAPAEPQAAPQTVSEEASGTPPPPPSWWKRFFGLE